MPELLDTLIRRFEPPSRPQGNAGVRDTERPVVFMHIPKTGGAALIGELEATLAPSRVLRGFDRCLFGAFDGFDSMIPAERARIFTDPATVTPGADLVVAHMAYGTLRAAYPTAQFLTVLREPFARLLSLWTYWRTSRDDDLAAVGTWAEIVRAARAPLAAFLNDPRAACQTDNQATRMLLWPHRLIPPDGFIDAYHDELLLREAQARLDTFALVDIAEAPDRAALRTWFGKALGHERANETPPVPPATRARLDAELTEAAIQRLDACSRLDLQLWRRIGAMRMDPAELERLRGRTLLTTAAHHAALLGGG